MIRVKESIKPEQPGNIIERQADKYITSLMGHTVDTVPYVKQAISEIRDELLEYNNYNHRLIFLERIRYRIKLGWENHEANCMHKASGTKCHKDEMFEDLLFFIQNEIEEVKSMSSPEYLTQDEKTNVTQLLTKIIEDINVLKLSSEFTYDDIINELEEIKSLYFLNKKTLTQVITGKFTEMVAGGLVSETISKGIVESIKASYPAILESLK